MNLSVLNVYLLVPIDGLQPSTGEEECDVCNLREPAQ